MRFRPSFGDPLASISLLVLAICLLTQPAGPCAAQELEPRRWSHLPIDMNFLRVAYGRKGAEIDFDPALRLENATREMQTVAFAYARTFEVFGKVGRVDLIQAWNDSEWVGPLDGQPASTGRRGLADTRIRLSANIVGAPALAGKDYAACRAGTKVETIAGVGLAVDLPTGQYDSGKLINFGGRTSINGEPNDDRREDLL